MSEKEKRALVIKGYEEALARKNHYSSATSLNNNGNNVWKMMGLIGIGILGGIGIGCAIGVIYLLGQNSGRRNSCKC